MFRSLTEWVMVSDERLDECLRATNIETEIVLDFETSGLDRYKDCIVSIQVGCPSTGRVFYLPLRHARGINLTNPHDVLVSLWNTISCKRLIGKNLVFDIRRAMEEGLEMPLYSFNEIEGAAVMHNVNEPWLELESLAAQYVNPDAGAEEKVMIDKIMADVPFLKKPSEAKGHLWYMRPEDIFEYGCADIRDTWALHEFYREHRTEKEEQAYQTFCDFQRVLFKLEERGMAVSREELLERLTGCETAMSQLETEFKGKVARGVNLASSQQVAKMFGLRHADDLHLSQVEGDRKPIAEMVLKWRQFEKAVSTYLRPLDKYLKKQEVL